MFSEDDLKHIKLHTPLNIDVLGFACPQGLARERVVLDARVGVEHTAEHRVLVHVQGHRPVDNVREVKVHYVVSSYDIRIHLDEEVSPSLEKLLLTFKRIDLTADDRSASIQGKDVAHEWLCLALDFHNVCDLNNGILLGLRELALFGRALNIE